MRTIAIVNQKGGCGKTTTAINLAAVFAARGVRTLLVDMDPQSHCAAGLGVPESGIETGVGEALLADHDQPQALAGLLWEVARDLHLAPSTTRLAALEAPGGGLHQLPDRDRRLESLLRAFDGRFDLCLIDCPPTIGLLTFSALRAAREALIPVETGYFSLKGAQKQCWTIQKTIDRIGRPIACHLLPTMHDPGSTVACDILVALNRDFAGQIVPAVIREHEALREAASYGQPVIEYAPGSEAARDFEALADWLEEHAARGPEIEIVHSGRAAAAGDADGGGLAPATGDDRTGDAPLAGGRAAEMARRVRDLALRYEAKTSAAGRDHAGAAATVTHARMPALQSEISNLRSQISDFRSEDSDPESEASDPKSQIPNPKSQVSNLEPQISNLKSEISDHRSEVSNLNSEIAASTSSPAASLAHVFGATQVGRSVLFAQPAGSARAIAVAGDFNDWSPSATPLRYNADTDTFESLIEIPPGVYRYRLLIDGQWLADPYNARHAPATGDATLKDSLLVVKWDGEVER